MATIVGWNLGDEDPQRAERAVWVATGLIATVTFVTAGITDAFPTDREGGS